MLLVIGCGEPNQIFIRESRPLRGDSETQLRGQIYGFFWLEALTIPPYCVYYNSNCMKNLMKIDYSLEDFKEEVEYINAPVESDSWLISANDSMVEKMEAKYE